MRDPKRSRLNLSLSFITICAIVFLDRFTKALFTQKLLVGESIPVIRNIFHFTLVHNTGIAFGLFRDEGIILIIIPIIILIVILAHMFRHRQSITISRIDNFAFSLIIGGAIGNMIDRIQFGYVIDFIDLRVWPVFNIADSAITIGTTIIVVKILIECIQSFAK